MFHNISIQFHSGKDKGAHCLTLNLSENTLNRIHKIRYTVKTDKRYVVLFCFSYYAFFRTGTSFAVLCGSYFRSFVYGFYPYVFFASALLPLFAGRQGQGIYNQCRSRKRETHRKRRCVYQRIYGGNAYLRTLGRTASNYTRFNMAHYAQRIFGRPQQYRLGRV